MPAPSEPHVPSPEDAAGQREALRFRGHPGRDSGPRERSGRSPAAEAGTAMGGPRLVERILREHPDRVHRVLLLRDSGEPWLYELQKLAERHRIQVQQVDWQVLDSWVNPNHGAVAILHTRSLSPWETVRADLVANPQTVVVLAGLEDPHNLGACARSCLALGSRTLLLPGKGSVGMTPAALRASAGALDLLDVCKPPVLEHALDDLLSADYEIVGLDGRGTPIHEGTFSERLVVILGGEDKGIPPYLRKRCSRMVRIPMNASAHSFNASVALSLALYEIARQRSFPGMQG